MSVETKEKPADTTNDNEDKIHYIREGHDIPEEGSICIALCGYKGIQRVIPSSGVCKECEMKAGY